DGGFRLDYVCRLTPDWRAVSLQVERGGGGNRRVLALERDGRGWLVDGPRPGGPDEGGEPGLVVTPFFKQLPVSRLLGSDPPSLTLDVAYVNGADLTVSRSRQRYERQAPGRIRYVDLGLFPGFEAELHIDAAMFVLSYECLFERVKLS